MSAVSEKLNTLSAEKKKKLSEILKISGEEYGVYPLSAEQKRMWFLYNVGKNSSYYNITFGIGIKGELDEGLLEKAIAGILDDQKILRTNIIVLDGEAFQTVDAEYSFSLKTVEARDSKEEDKIFSDEYRKPFDLEREIPFRAILLRRSAADNEEIGRASCRERV